MTVSRTLYCVLGCFFGHRFIRACTLWSVSRLYVIGTFVHHAFVISHALCYHRAASVAFKATFFMPCHNVPQGPLTRGTSRRLSYKYQLRWIFVANRQGTIGAPSGCFSRACLPGRCPGPVRGASPPVPPPAASLGRSMEHPVYLGGYCCAAWWTLMDERRRRLCRMGESTCALRRTNWRT